MNSYDSGPRGKKLINDETSDRPTTMRIETETAHSYKKDSDEADFSGSRKFKFSKGLMKTDSKRGTQAPSFLSENDGGGGIDKSAKSSVIFEKAEFDQDLYLADIERIVAVMEEPQELIKAIHNYRPVSRNIDIKDIRKSSKTKIKRFKDAVYFGEVFNEKRHGTGVLIFRDMHFYEGEWENDTKHGKGFELTPTGSRYEGNYSNGKPDGFGIFVWPNGEIYEGEWKNGLKHGSGMWKGNKGESYLGEWKFGKQEGNGVFVWRNGDKYEGEFKAFLKHGHGVEKFANGDYYTGHYRNGKPHGYGEYYWVNGSQYKGFFKNGLRHGKGVWRSSAGPKADEYDGEWVNDKKCGFGVFKWISGNYYEGEFFDDARQGYGVMHWIDGSYYKGHWERGIQNGEGELYVPGRDPKIGLFQNNIYVGYLYEGGEQTQEEQKQGGLSSGKISKQSSPSKPKGPTGLIKPGLLAPMKHISAVSLHTEEDGAGERSNSPDRLRTQTGRSKNNSKSPGSKGHDLSYLSEQQATLPKKKKKKKKNRSASKHKDHSPQDAKVSPRLYDTQRSPRIPPGCLLNQKEWIRWNYLKDNLNINPKKYKDLTKPEVCFRIRKFIYPPVWKPPGNLKVDNGKSEIMSPLLILYPHLNANGN